jgi:2-polyprenyl-3-methyl-5-hydroxy-6-metoxy-1,4-benzoquinol methylase
MRAYFEAVWEAIPEGLEPAHASARLTFLLASAPAGGRVLDLGCGEGWFTRALSDAKFEVVGADVAQEPLRRARRLRPDLDLRLIEAAGGWPLRDAEFDAVWAGEVIEHVHDTSAWLSCCDQGARCCSAHLPTTSSPSPRSR